MMVIYFWGHIEFDVATRNAGIFTCHQICGTLKHKAIEEEGMHMEHCVMIRGDQVKREIQGQNFYNRRREREAREYYELYEDWSLS